MSRKLIFSLLFFLLSSSILHPLNITKEFARGITLGSGLLLGTSATLKALEYCPTFKKNYLHSPPPPTFSETLIENIPNIISTAGSILFFGIILYQVKQIVLQNNNTFSLHKAGTIKETFATIAGNDEIKNEVQDIVAYLKNPESFNVLGAKVPKGILLTGCPGTGKTLLARALAGEANCSFISCSGSDFVEMYVGTGASRIRNLFAMARTHQPCIIFIDEIDALAMKRSASPDGGTIEYNQTVNQLLSEMDGFTKDEKPIIVIGATNYINNLDPAILRPGRFDRILRVHLPNAKERKAILLVHLQKIIYDTQLDINKIAQATPGFSGADLANLVNEAAIIATKKNIPAVTIAEFEEAKDKISLGIKNTTIKMTYQEKKLTAYHEAGHALIALLSPHQNHILNKITILPQGSALGATHFVPEKELYSMNKEQLLAQINIDLGGRAAEELVFNEITTGASNDFEKASKLARAMICKYGMTNILGKQVLLSNKSYSQETLKKIDDGVTIILEKQYQETINILKAHRSQLELLAKTLLAKETLSADEVYALLNITPRKTCITL